MLKLASLALPVGPALSGDIPSKTVHGSVWLSEHRDFGRFPTRATGENEQKEIQSVKSDLLLFLFHLFPVFFLFSLIPRFIVLHLPYIPRHREDERHTHGDGETCRAVEERAIPENAGEEVSSFPHS